MEENRVGVFDRPVVEEDTEELDKRRPVRAVPGADAASTVEEVSSVDSWYVAFG